MTTLSRRDVLAMTAAAAATGVWGGPWPPRLPDS